MWFIIWNKYVNNGSFNLHDLTVLAGAKKGTARWYLKALRRAGYILPSRKAGPGVEWRLTGNFGPKRPYICSERKQKREDKSLLNAVKMIQRKRQIQPALSRKRAV
jgi:predicted transcriptional regulator